MKKYVSNTLCVLAIAVPCVLVAVGSLISCFAAMIIVVLAYAHAKDYPHVWRRFYKNTMQFVAKLGVTNNN